MEIGSKYKWEEYNVLLVTLDACRFDSLARARTPNLDSLGSVRRAVTAGSFTLPAHMAFFSGYLPNVVEYPLEDYYSRERFQLWRLTRAKRKASSSYGLLLAGDTITEGFANKGYFTLGVGGVRWFLTSTLQSLFHDFYFWGPKDYTEWFAVRDKFDFALEHVDEIASTLAKYEKWFCFVNCLETHAPYNNGLDPTDSGVMEIIERLEPIWAGREEARLQVRKEPDDFRILHFAQMRAAEVVDSRLGRLFGLLERPCIVVVCGDHGECFGEGGKWGHGFPAKEVMEVPVVVGFLE